MTVRLPYSEMTRAAFGDRDEPPHLVAVVPSREDGQPCLWALSVPYDQTSAQYALATDDRVRVGQMLGVMIALHRHHPPT